MKTGTNSESMSVLHSKLPFKYAITAWG